ncbi:uncharacterized protein TM35_000521070 [Trypanosoma theileri]|uniref:Mucin-associated surface protein (MASP) n=1 Tax=Trypanosoma theileri TaxID=67003 RepID=A0A1X0NHL1_9TRYP|nr:uncharacterized protein TM35_000521070 [Trypanosoma theileri]ORC83963.1 hypothetical protein TM35_000521070 [Trypanosoma theileri]
MLMMMGRVMCVLAVVLCCTCGYTMAAAASGSAGQPKAEMAFFTDVFATEARIVGFIPVEDDKRQSSNLAKPDETKIVSQHTSGQGNDSLGPQEILGGIGSESVEGSRLMSLDSGEKGRDNQLRENEVVLPGPEAKEKDGVRTDEQLDQTQREQKQQLGGTGGTLAGQSEQRTVESPPGQDGLSASAHQSNAISHASDSAASDINLPGVGTNSGHSPAAMFLLYLYLPRGLRLRLQGTIKLEAAAAVQLTRTVKPTKPLQLQVQQRTITQQRWTQTVSIPLIIRNRTPPPPQQQHFLLPTRSQKEMAMLLQPPPPPQQQQHFLL